MSIWILIPIDRHFPVGPHMARRSPHRALEQLRVTTAGIGDLSDIVGASDISGLAFRLETWNADNGYTGAMAAADAAFVARIEKILRDNWPNPSSTYID
jgi:hypothetical protein